MKFLWTDKHGNQCAAKAMFTIGCLSVFASLLFGGQGFIAETNWREASGVLAVLGTVYWGRNHTKASNGGK